MPGAVLWGNRSVKPTISVLMVTYNASRFLARAVESILAQTERNLELILIDNASTDGSVADLRRHCTDTRLRIYPQTHNLRHNGGLTAGLPHCQGRFIAIMDADDVSLPDRLRRQMDTLEADPTLAGVGCAAATINDEDEVVGREFCLSDRQEIRCYARFEMPFVFPTLLARREVLLEHPFRAEFPVAHDLDWLARACARHDFIALPDTLFHYRRHKAATTSRARVHLFATASVVRFASAHRRENHAEDLESLLREHASILERNPSEAEVFTAFARLALSKQLWLQAAWHARKAAVFGRRWKGATLLLATLARARNLPSAERAELHRLALLGTVRAYRLHPQME